MLQAAAHCEGVRGSGIFGCVGGGCGFEDGLGVVWLLCCVIGGVLGWGDVWRVERRGECWGRGRGGEGIFIDDVV